MPEEQKTTTDDSKTAPLTMGELGTLIAEKIKEILPTVTGKSGETQPPKSTQDSGGKVDIASQVQAELAKLKAREDKQKADNDVQTRLAALEKPKEEKTPIERSRVHKLMGWGENE